MIQEQTVLDAADNSGARKLFCIKVLGGTGRRYATVGDIIVVSIREALPNAKVKKGEVMKAVVVQDHQGGQAARRKLYPLREQLRGPDQPPE